MKKCYLCGEELKDGMERCPQCGAPVPEVKRKKKESRKGIAGLIFGLLLPPLGIVLCLVDLIDGVKSERHIAGRIGLLVASLMEIALTVVVVEMMPMIMSIIG